MPPSIPLGTSLKTGALFGGGFSLAGKELQDCYAGEVNVHTGKRQGRGKYVYPNKAFSYEGEYLDGKKHGFGRFEIKGHSYYEGEFSKDELTGKGVQVYENGNTYEGDFVLGERHGKGISFDKGRNERYTGDFERNARHGEGVLVLLATETTYEGQFQKHKPCGRGKVLVPATQQIYEGNFIRDEEQTLEGLSELKIGLSGDGGLVESVQGHKQGQFEKTMLHGQGLRYDATTGITYEGMFDHDKAAQEPKRITCSFIQVTREDEQQQQDEEVLTEERKGEEEGAAEEEESTTERPTEASDASEEQQEGNDDEDGAKKKTEEEEEAIETERGPLVLESPLLELNSNEIEETWGSFGIQIRVETEAKQALPPRPANPEPNPEAETLSGSEATSQKEAAEANANAPAADSANEEDAKNNSSTNNDGGDDESTSEPKFCTFSNESGRIIHLKCRMEEGASEEGQPEPEETSTQENGSEAADASAESVKKVKSIELDLPRTSNGLVTIDNFGTLFNTLEVGQYTLEFSSFGLGDNHELAMVIK